jgi:hypothetical protein
MSVTTPSTGQKISDFSAGNVDANSYFIQANSGSTSKVSASQIGQFSNLNLLFSGAGGLDTTAKTIVGAINEVNRKEASDITYDNTSSGLNATDVQAAIDEVNDKGIEDMKDVNLSSPADGNALIYDSATGKWVNRKIAGGVITFTPAEGVTINALSSWKTDRLCGISFDLKGITTTAGTMTTIGTVDIQPSAMVRSGITNIGNGGHVGIARVNVQGTVSIMTESALSSSSSIAFSFVYRSRT